MSARLLLRVVGKQVNLVSGQLYLSLAFSLFSERNFIRVSLDLFSGLRIALQVSCARRQKLWK